MDTKNSYSIYLEVVKELYRDIADCYSVTRRVQRTEINYIESRFSKEGISFLTKSLPLLGKAFDKAISSGTFLSVVGFTTDGGGRVPKFLGWLLRRVFDVHGYELDQPDPIAVKHFRQLVYLVYKLEIPYDRRTSEKVLQSFVSNDHGLPDKGGTVAFNHATNTYSLLSKLWASDNWLERARDLVSRVVSGLDPYGAHIEPRHGPGAVATGESTIEKTKFSRIYSHLEQCYPFTEWFMFNMQHVADARPDLDPRVSLVDEATAKVVLVPKDSRGPRLISCEPLEIQWIQQGLGRALMSTIENHRLTRGHVNFTDQRINRDLAKLGSKNQQWVTLDMKDASDLVSLELVKYLFSGHPKLLEALLATRSPSTRLPNGTVVRLKKFAPMGSALCFPVESLVFWALAVSAIRLNSSYAESVRSVYVYGDDIIVRKKDYTILTQLFPVVGLKFNEAKCCTARFFRESCGCDAYDGIDVTPVRVKTVWSRRRSDPKCLESYSALSNALYEAGYFRTSEYLRTLIVDTYGRIPYVPAGQKHIGETKVSPTLLKFMRPEKSNLSLSPISVNDTYGHNSSGIVFTTYEPCKTLNAGIRSRWNKNLHRKEYFTWMSQPAKVKTPYDGYSEMLRRFSAGYGPHGGVYALVRRNRLKRTWTAAW